ncbi:MAG TPA: MBL fold metallo-hydrolase, partial [Nitrososphaera sp.]
NPAIEISELPPLDFILLSHFHGDHFDQAAIHGFNKSLPIVTNEHAIEELSARGFTNFEKLEKWESGSSITFYALKFISVCPQIMWL